MDNIRVQKKSVQQNKVLTVYDIFDISVGKALEDKHAKRNNKREYDKISIPNKPKENHRFFIKCIKDLIDAQDLWGENKENEISIEYLTKNGWVGKPEEYKYAYRNNLWGLPQRDKNVASGDANNILSADEQILIARVNVFDYN